MNRNKDAYNRLSGIMALLMSDRSREGISVCEISRQLNVPLEVVIHDIISLTADRHMSNSIKLSDNSDKEKWKRSLKKAEDRALKLKFRVDPRIFLPDENGDLLAVYLTPFEKNVFARSVNVSYLSDPVWIKEPVLAVSAEPPGILGPLQMAIEQGHPVSFVYSAETGHINYDSFIPRSIYMDQFSKKTYLAGTAEGRVHDLKRVDHIKELTVHNDKDVPALKAGELDLLDYIWGADIEPGEKPDEKAGERGNGRFTESVDGSYEAAGTPEYLDNRYPELVEGYRIRHIKIKIHKETANIYEKIKTETKGRRFGKLYDDTEDENIAYYEDDVCGMGSFKRWLLGYGASVIVVEPYELAEDICRILMRRLEKYEKDIIGTSLS